MSPALVFHVSLRDILPLGEMAQHYTHKEGEGGEKKKGEGRRERKKERKKKRREER